jgi:Tfp pilus assembly protein PilO
MGNVLFYLQGLQPLIEARQGHSQRLLALQGKIRALQAQGEALEGQMETLQEAEEFRLQFPERNQVVRVGGELKQIAATLGLRMPSIAYQPEPSKDADLLRVKLNLSVEGTYEQVRRFLYELEKRRQYLVVEQMGLTEQRGQASTSHVAMQLGLSGYFR